MTGAGADPGILLTIAPAVDVAADLPTLIRLALDAEQVGAGRLHLPADLPDPERTVRELRAGTDLVITCEPGGAVAALCGQPAPSFTDVVIEPAAPAELLTTIAALSVDVRATGRAVSVSGRGSAGLPVALAAIAGGLHLRVGTADAVAVDVVAVDAEAAHPTGADPVDSGAPAPPSARPDVALIARAAGLARIAGRPPIRGAAAAALLGVVAGSGSGDFPPSRSAPAAVISMEKPSAD